MKSKYLPIVFLLAWPAGLQAQLFTVGNTASLTIQSGTLFHAGGLSLTPSANWTIGNNSLIHNTAVTNATSQTYVSRVYTWNSTTAPYSGTVQINYLDAELNGLTESLLKVNIHDGSSWAAINSTTNDVTNNYVLSNSFSAKPLDELTLALQLYTLPLRWQYFTVQQQQQQALLNWTTAAEQNTKDFIIQHSTTGTAWRSLSTQPAAGNSTGLLRYSYLHTNPVKGINYYRILQTDLDHHFSYSPVRLLKISDAGASVSIIRNPVVNGVLELQVNKTPAQSIKIYSARGTLEYDQQLPSGMNYIDMSRFAKGAYLLVASGEKYKVLLQ